MIPSFNNAVAQTPRCSDVFLNFAGLSMGDDINDINTLAQLADNGIAITSVMARNPVNTPFQNTVFIYDSFGNARDPDLEHEFQNNDPIPPGGDWPSIGNMPVIPEDDVDPNRPSTMSDWIRGGTIEYTFDDLRILKSFMAVDDLDRTSEIRLFDSFDVQITSIAIDQNADNFNDKVFRYDDDQFTDVSDVKRMEVFYPSSGAITNFELGCVPTPVCDNSPPPDTSGLSQGQVLGTTCVPGGSKIIIVKDTIPDDPADFSFTHNIASSPTVVSPFKLDDDADPALKNTQVFNNVLPGTFTVTETTISSSFSPSVTCDPSGGTTTAGTLATITIATREIVTCTFTNAEASGVRIRANPLPVDPQIVGDGRITFKPGTPLPQDNSRMLVELTGLTNFANQQVSFQIQGGCFVDPATGTFAVVPIDAAGNSNIEFDDGGQPILIRGVAVGDIVEVVGGLDCTGPVILRGTFFEVPRPLDSNNNQPVQTSSSHNDDDDLDYETKDMLAKLQQKVVKLEKRIQSLLEKYEDGKYYGPIPEGDQVTKSYSLSLDGSASSIHDDSTETDFSGEIFIETLGTGTDSSKFRVTGGQLIIGDISYDVIFGKARTTFSTSGDKDSMVILAQLLDEEGNVNTLRISFVSKVSLQDEASEPINFEISQRSKIAHNWHLSASGQLSILEP